MCFFYPVSDKEGRMAKKRRMFVIYNLLPAILLFVGCSDLRKYVSSDRGAVILRAKNTFGEGEEIKEYCVTDGEIVNLSDTKTKVLNILGNPDKATRSLDGCDIWSYNSKGLEIHFLEGNVKNIHEFQPKL